MSGFLTIPGGHEAPQLLSLLHGGHQSTFQTFDESPAKKSDLTRILHGSWEQHRETLESLNERGAGVFFMVNLGDGKGRASRNVKEVRALFVDLDGAPVEPVFAASLQPHAIVETSPARFHAYWLVDAVPLAEFSSLQLGLAKRFQGDQKVRDLPRVMRLPGFGHQKGRLFKSRLLAIEPSLPPYHHDVMVEEFGLTVETRPLELAAKLVTLEESIALGTRNDTLFGLARGLVNKGFAPEDVLKRVQRVNAERCRPPLCATEVDTLVASACNFGATGYLNLPLAVFDSDEYRNLSHAARTVAATAYRRFNGENNGNIALPFDDFRREFTRPQSFYRARDEVIRSGLLRVVRKRRYHERGGRQPDLFEVAMKPPSVGIQRRLASN